MGLRNRKIQNKGFNAPPFCGKLFESKFFRFMFRLCHNVLIIKVQSYNNMVMYLP